MVKTTIMNTTIMNTTTTITIGTERGGRRRGGLNRPRCVRRIGTHRGKVHAASGASVPHLDHRKWSFLY